MNFASGFLLSPLTSLLECETPLAPETARQIEAAAAALPAWLQAGTARAELEALPEWDTGWLTPETDARLLERLLALYGYFASAYVHGASPTAKHLPANIAVPLARSAECLGRPPMLAYAGMVLNNWRLIDEAGDFTVENIDIPLTFTPLPDEKWFFRVHVAIEARSAAMLTALEQSFKAAEKQNMAATLRALREIIAGLADITRIFHRMGDGVDPDVYYQQIRPYMFGMDGVIYEGVSAEPQSLRGGSGAQSSVIPAMLAGLGIQHEHNELTGHLHSMQSYMPREHRQMISRLNSTLLRDWCATRAPLRDAYNHALRSLMTFRRAHLYYAKTYIFAKSTNPVGTGGTMFMDFLARLVQETEAHLL